MLTNLIEEDPFSILPQLPLIVAANHLVYQSNKITKIQIGILDRADYGEKAQTRHKSSRQAERATEPIFGWNKKKRLSDLMNNNNKNMLNKSGE